MHSPQTGAKWVLAFVLGSIITSCLVTAVATVRDYCTGTEWVRKRAGKLGKNRTQRVVDLAMTPLFLLGFCGGMIATADFGWAVADACSCQALGFVVWGVWAFVESLEECISYEDLPTDKNGKSQKKQRVAVDVETLAAHQSHRRKQLQQHLAADAAERSRKTAAVPQAAVNKRPQVKNPLDFSPAIRRA
ncbi:hypothetical protein DIPPA_64014 [Diplonema papillatum]|nr:hypothetical protein DIPPA_64014 [Diplonema papillatum]